MATLKDQLEASLAWENRDVTPYTPRHKREDAPDVKPHLRLIDIGDAATAINDLLFDMQGELTPETEAALDELLTKGADKLDAAAWVLRKLAGEAETCKAEATRYRERQQAAERQCEALKARMLYALDAAFGGKLRTDRNTIWSQDSPKVTQIELAADADIQVLDRDNSEFVRKTYELDKVAIRHRYEAGDPIPDAIKITPLPGKRHLRVR